MTSEGQGVGEKNATLPYGYSLVVNIGTTTLTAMTFFLNIMRNTGRMKSEINHR
jgi:hypothetical protein